ncbi:Protein of unknown function [Bacillus cereus]|nr:Protein of unknown function [Bacillus cereus]
MSTCSFVTDRKYGLFHKKRWRWGVAGVECYWTLTDGFKHAW